MRTFIPAFTAFVGAALLACSAHAMSPTAPVATPQSLIVPVSDNGNCGWYAISVCTDDWDEAQQAANLYGGYPINTSDVDGFAPGWICAVVGPSSKSEANYAKKQARRAGAKTAYIKEGCE